MDIYTDGARPQYAPLAQKEVPDDGYPHNAAIKANIMESIWGGMISLKVI